MIETVMNNIMENNLIEKNENIVVAVSGGADSMALLYALIEIRSVLDFNIIIAHVNHGVRGEDADSDQEFVRQKSIEMELPFYTINVDMNAYAKEQKISSEEAGRLLRYNFFREIIKEKRSGKIAVAHNKNDQAETLLLRIMRGTGIDGLKGMDFISGDIIRPLLNISRDEIEKYIENNKIDTVLDKTNLLPIYNRNKVRLELLPYMEENFNQNIIEALWRLSRSSKADVSYLEEITEKKYKLLMKYVSKHSIILDRALFCKEDLSLKFRLIRKCINKLEGNLQGISENHISALVKLFESNDTGKQLNLPNGIIGRVSYDDLIIENEMLDKIKDFEYNLFEGDNNFPEIGVCISISVYSHKIPINKDNNINQFDFDKVKGKLKIRNRKNGDRFMPFGMSGYKKIKDYFIDNKVPRDIRDKIPLLVDDENIIWIAGFAISDLYKITKNTKKILVVEYKKD